MDCLSSNPPVKGSVRSVIDSRAGVYSRRAYLQMPWLIDTSQTIDESNSFPRDGLRIQDGVQSPTTVHVADGGFVAWETGEHSTVTDSSRLFVDGGVLGGPISVERHGQLQLSNGGFSFEHTVFGSQFDWMVSTSGNGTVEFSGIDLDGRIGWPLNRG